MISRRRLMVAALLAGSIPLRAQIPGMWNWWDRPIAQDLNLSEEQRKQIRATVRESRDRLIQLRGAVEAAIERVVKSRGELMRAVSQMSLKLRLVLTPAQWQELRKRERRPPGPPRGNMRDHEMRGPGHWGSDRPRNSEPGAPPPMDDRDL